MIVVADSGSTKTAWGVPGMGRLPVTEGLNPHFTTDNQVLSACNLVRAALPEPAAEVYFYGAGCGDSRQRQRMVSLLLQGFAGAHVYVDTDLLGACRAACGNSAGLVTILGTGSNACYYDGVQPTAQPFSTGFILGDHGSGNHIGRMLLHDYLTGRMPARTRHLFAQVCTLTDHEIMDAVYQQPHPNRFLARMGGFAATHQDDPYCRALLAKALRMWYSYMMQPVARHTACRTLYAVGGLAAALEEELRKESARHGLELRKVVADPLEGLFRYHSA